GQDLFPVGLVEDLVTGTGAGDHLGGLASDRLQPCPGGGEGDELVGVGWLVLMVDLLSPPQPDYPQTRRLTPVRRRGGLVRISPGLTGVMITRSRSPLTRPASTLRPSGPLRGRTRRRPAGTTGSW